jgi:hypothetical protein
MVTCLSIITLARRCSLRFVAEFRVDASISNTAQFRDLVPLRWGYVVIRPAWALVWPNRTPTKDTPRVSTLWEDLDRYKRPNFSARSLPSWAMGGQHCPKMDAGGKVPRCRKLVVDFPADIFVVGRTFVCTMGSRNSSFHEKASTQASSTLFEIWQSSRSRCFCAL